MITLYKGTEVPNTARNNWRKAIQYHINKGEAEIAGTFATMLTRMCKQGVIPLVDYKWKYVEVFVYNEDNTGTWYGAPGMTGAPRPKDLKKWQPNKPKTWQWNSVSHDKTHIPFEV